MTRAVAGIALCLGGSVLHADPPASAGSVRPPGEAASGALGQLAASDAGASKAQSWALLAAGLAAATFIMLRRRAD